MPEPSEDLAVRAVGGDAQAFAALLERYERAALAVAYGAAPNAAGAADAVQEAAFRAWKNRRSLKDSARFAAWFLQIVRHAAIDHQRVTQRHAGDVFERADAAPGPAEAAHARETAAVIGKSIAALEETTRMIVLLRYYENASTQQIADLLELTPAAVDMRLSRARQELKRMLAPMNDAEPMPMTVTP